MIIEPSVKFRFFCLFDVIEAVNVLCDFHYLFVEFVGLLVKLLVAFHSKLFNIFLQLLFEFTYFQILLGIQTVLFLFHLCELSFLILF